MKPKRQLKQPTSKEDTFTRAAWLFGNDYVRESVGDDLIRCWSQRFGEDRIYDVTTFTCTCWIGENRRKKICKHRFACFAPVVALLVLELREATSEDALESIALGYREALKTLDPVFVEQARVEYRKCREALRQAA